LTSALVGGEWSASRPGHFTRTKRAKVLIKLTPEVCLTARQETKLYHSNVHETDYLLITTIIIIVVRVLGYRSGDPGSIPGSTRTKIVGLERGALSLVSTTEELLERKVAAPVQKTEIRP
jgi:hypothetical protein